MVEEDRAGSTMRLERREKCERQIHALDDGSITFYSISTVYLSILFSASTWPELIPSSSILHLGWTIIYMTLTAPLPCRRTPRVVPRYFAHRLCPLLLFLYQNVLRRCVQDKAVWEASRNSAKGTEPQKGPWYPPPPPGKKKGEKSLLSCTLSTRCRIEMAEQHVHGRRKREKRGSTAGCLFGYNIRNRNRNGKWQWKWKWTWTLITLDSSIRTQQADGQTGRQAYRWQHGRIERRGKGSRGHKKSIGSRCPAQEDLDSTKREEKSTITAGNFGWALDLIWFDWFDGFDWLISCGHTEHIQTVPSIPSIPSIPREPYKPPQPYTPYTPAHSFYCVNIQEAEPFWCFFPSPISLTLYLHFQPRPYPLMLTVFAALPCSHYTRLLVGSSSVPHIALDARQETHTSTCSTSPQRPRLSARRTGYGRRTRLPGIYAKDKKGKRETIIAQKQRRKRSPQK